jgi:hypothetical protein
MSGTLNLNCWAIGDDPRRIFTVHVAKTDNVSALKKLIKEKQLHSMTSPGPLAGERTISITLIHLML